MIENGQMTTDLELVGKVVKDVSYNNSINYFGV
jgi:glucuronate isomerase